MKSKFKANDKISIPWNGAKVEATIIDVLNTQLFVQFDSGQQGFVFQSEAKKLKRE